MVIGVLGGFAALFVVAVVGFWLAGSGREPSKEADGSHLRTGSKSAALAGPLYRSGSLSRVPCRLPKIAEGDEASMRTFLQTLSDCLDTAWNRQFAKAGVAGFTAPQRVFWSTPGSSPCGSYPAPGASAFYCPANDTMYVGLSNIVETAGGEPVSHYAVFARVIAHEYGHHVQEDAGILEYGHELMASGGGGAPAEASRRIELQAQCFAGAFLSAERRTLPMTARQYREMINDNLLRGDGASQPQDHGSGKHYAGWVARGYRGGALSACDTWTVPASDVS
ncbi:neutral zinc metallopeptidase [Actinomadura sp. DC4]|uniref:neutral zinc metallopeptidase n=1 Tax=Actinomadura sp. DC4 TaxID=3055069 RepID=UPI0025AEEA54|nr:neutral zinc metallopeptidase [Actinomadura sp. DC4]MDN3359738.1 neutral zinc metallopeptidase [Actinomadura sp. DC4]